MALSEIRPVVVVGTDGSAGSVKALRWALRQAEATGAEVRVVLAWEVTAPLGYVATVDDVDWAAPRRCQVNHRDRAGDGRDGQNGDRGRAGYREGDRRKGGAGNGNPRCRRPG